MLLGLTLGLPVISLMLRAVGFSRTLAWIERHSAALPTKAPTSNDLASAERLAQLVDIAGRHGPISATCLRQSLLLHGLLRRRGLLPQLRIGVRRQEDGIDAHAWVELQGRPLGQAVMGHVALARPAGA